MSMLTATFSLEDSKVGGVLPCMGAVQINVETMATIAETFSRLYRSGWNQGGITVSTRDGLCSFQVKGRVADSLIQAEGETLVTALQRALTDVRLLNEGQSARVAG